MRRQSMMLGACVREKPIGPYRYVYLVESVRENGHTKQRIIKNLGRKEQVEAKGDLDRLARSAARLAQRSMILSLIDQDGLPTLATRRIGRTARAGKSGVAISFCDAEERAYLRDIEALIKVRIPVIADHPWHSASPVPQAKTPRRRPKPRATNGQGRSGSGRARATPAPSQKASIERSRHAGGRLR